MHEDPAAVSAPLLGVMAGPDRRAHDESRPAPDRPGQVEQRHRARVGGPAAPGDEPVRAALPVRGELRAEQLGGRGRARRDRPRRAARSASPSRPGAAASRGRGPPRTSTGARRIRPTWSHAVRRTSRKAAIAHGTRRARSMFQWPGKAQAVADGRAQAKGPDASEERVRRSWGMRTPSAGSPRWAGRAGARSRPRRGSRAPASSSVSSAPGRRAMSALAAASHSDDVWRATRLIARPKPRFSARGDEVHPVEALAHQVGRPVLRCVVDHPHLGETRSRPPGPATRGTEPAARGCSTRRSRWSRWGPARRRL